MNKFNNKTKGVILLSILVIIGASLYYFYVVKDEGIEIYENEVEKNVLIPYEDDTNTSGQNNVSLQKIIVDISGEVKKPGVVELEEGDRIKDAIELAGGLTKNADTTDINLAYKLEDGMKIKVPSKAEKENQNTQQNQEYVSTEAGENVKQQDNSSKSKSKVININTATKEELDTLPGIGESTANKIIQYREEKGKFNKKEDIKNVSGIGDAKYEKIKDYISV